MRSDSARKHLEKHRKQAAEAFAKHVITKQSEGRWLLQRIHEDGKPDGTMFAEVICLAGTALYVGGDIQHCIFAYGPQHPIARVRWMGECKDLDYYVRQKANIGMCDARNANVRWDAEICKDELHDYLQDQSAEDEFESCFNSDHHFSDVMDVMSAARLNLETQEEFIRWAHNVFDCDVFSEVVARMGEVLAPSVIYAQAALERLCKLLDEESGKDGGWAMTREAAYRLVESEIRGMFPNEWPRIDLFYKSARLSSYAGEAERCSLIETVDALKGGKNG